MASNDDEIVCGPINWREEANAIIEDIRNHVLSISVSERLPQTEREIFLNCETREEKRFTIRLSADGYQIVGQQFDTKTEPTSIPYETPYALLNAISPGYVNSFGNELSNALSRLIQK